jgi:hypothetical protein
VVPIGDFLEMNERKPKLILVTIEPLKERYSIQWKEWFIDSMLSLNQIQEHEFSWETIDPVPLTRTITQGEFLDVCGTNHYKMEQLEIIISRIHHGDIISGDTILLLDGWFPGIEALFYIRDALNMSLPIYALLHAGTWDSYDFLSRKGMEEWAKGIEKSWLQQYKKIFVATNFHRELILSKERVPRDRAAQIEVTGFPLYWEADIWEHPPIDKTKKENICVFPHRIAPEKGLLQWEEFARSCKTHHPKWDFVRSVDVCSTKEQYYELLSRSKIAVSFAYQETWGIAMQEAIYSGCIPLVPDRLSYVEMYPGVFRFSNIDRAIEMFNSFVFDMETGNSQKSEYVRAKVEKSLRERNEQAIVKIFKSIDLIVSVGRTCKGLLPLQTTTMSMVFIGY